MKAKAVLFCALSLIIAGAPALAGTTSQCAGEVTSRVRAIDSQQQKALAEAGKVADPVERVKAQLAAIRGGDQGTRDVFMESQGKCPPDYSTDDLAEFRSRVSAIDARDKEVFKAILASSGWPVLSVYGEAADQTAFLVVQHADADPAFQQSMLKKLEELVAKKESSPKNLALLTDRIAFAKSLPQRYGSQGHCVDGKWEPFAIEDPAGVDARRAAMGLVPMRDYRDKLTGLFCAPAPAKP